MKLDILLIFALLLVQISNNGTCNTIDNYTPNSATDCINLPITQGIRCCYIFVNVTRKKDNFNNYTKYCYSINQEDFDRFDEVIDHIRKAMYVNGYTINNLVADCKSNAITLSFILFIFFFL